MDCASAARRTVYRALSSTLIMTSVYSMYNNRCVYDDVRSVSEPRLSTSENRFQENRCRENGLQKT